jgi:two-component system response regulator
MDASDRLIDILLVEDSASDVELTRCAFEEARLGNPLHVVGSGTEALDFIHRRGSYINAPRPDMLLLDLNLPEIDGVDILRLLRRDRTQDDIPIILLTGSRIEQDIAAASDICADGYIAKPLTLESLIGAVHALEKFRIGFMTGLTLKKYIA